MQSLILLGEVSPLSFFDKGVTIAVLAACGVIGWVLIKRWLKAMDAQEDRDASHQKAIEGLIEKHHTQMLEVYGRHAEDRKEFILMLHSISEGMKAVHTIVDRRHSNGK